MPIILVLTGSINFCFIYGGNIIEIGNTLGLGKVGSYLSPKGPISKSSKINLFEVFILF